jgi:hypothetical protein
MKGHVELFDIFGDWKQEQLNAEAANYDAQNQYKITQY